MCKLDSTLEIVYGYEVMTRFGYIAMLAVHENVRRQRVGSRLVEAAIHEMHACKCEEVGEEMRLNACTFCAGGARDRND